MNMNQAGSAKSRLRKGLIATVTAAALMFVAPVAAHAEESSPSDHVVQSDAQPVILTPTQVKDIEAEVAATDYDAQTFNALVAAKKGASAQGIADYATVLRDQGWTIIGSTKAASDTAKKVSAIAKASCKGFNGYHGYYFPWGSQFGVNSCNTAKLIAGAGLGTAGAGAVAAVLGLIGATGVGLPIAALAAALIGFGAAAIAACQAFSSNGAIWLNLGGTPTVSCWGQ